MQHTTSNSFVVVNIALSCTISELSDVEYYRDLELEVCVRYYSRSLEIEPFDRSHTSSYSSSIVTMAVSCMHRFCNKARYLLKNANFSYPLPFTLHDRTEPLDFPQNFNTDCASPYAIRLCHKVQLSARTSQIHRRQTDGSCHKANAT